MGHFWFPETTGPCLAVSWVLLTYVQSFSFTFRTKEYFCVKGISRADRDVGGEKEEQYEIYSPLKLLTEPQNREVMRRGWGRKDFCNFLLFTYILFYFSWRGPGEACSADGAGEEQFLGAMLVSSELVSLCPQLLP